MSHDWPAGITDFGDVERLLRFKPYFREDIERNQLGNPATMDLIYVGSCSSYQSYLRI